MTIDDRYFRGNLFSQLLEGTITVSDRFNRFLSNISLTQNQITDGIVKHSGVRSCLNRHYYGYSSDSANSFLIGSWGKDCQIRPPRDIDILFQFPYSAYQRFTQRMGNIQTQILQEVKKVLLYSYPKTDMRADGQVVMVPFDTYAIEVLPAILLESGQYWICDTHENGKFKTIDPIEEFKHAQASDTKTNGNTRDLIRMAKCWQTNCKVSIKSFCLELLAIKFLSTWSNAGNSTIYYDWMIRDFLKFLVNHSSFGLLNSLIVPGTRQLIYLGTDWKSKAESAYNRAIKACDFENKKLSYSAGNEWQKIFGNDIP